ncbi:MAG TPA: urea ABC transporter permease subunit UrtC [Verrucomicrobiae bacterium]|nr:urea ABC transporter permease subunit UrtC [Verrucomicrobiae bacterium]
MLSTCFKLRELWIIGILSFVALVLLPCLNAFVPATSALHVSSFTLSLYGKYLTYAVLALGVNLLWGYTGILSLGQCLFFALGGYALGMYLMLKIGNLGQYKAAIPDFMVFLEFATKYPESGGLPPHWIPFKQFWFAAAMVIVVPATVAYIFGFLAFRSRIKGVYFSILSQALTYAACLMFFRNDFTFGGNNGLTDFKFILGYDVNAPGTKRALYMCSAALLLGVYLFCRWLTSTKFGLIQRAIRDSENRVLFSGYATANFKLFVFVAAAVIAGLGGALFVPQVGIINPSEMSPEKSLEAVVWVAVGGRGSMLGPIIGAVGINALKSYATHAFAEQWPYILGLLFIFVTLFMPKGIIGLPAQFRELKRRYWNRGRTEPDRGGGAQRLPAGTEPGQDSQSLLPAKHPIQP